MRYAFSSMQCNCVKRQMTNYSGIYSHRQRTILFIQIRNLRGWQRFFSFVRFFLLLCVMWNIGNAERDIPHWMSHVTENRLSLVRCGCYSIRWRQQQWKKRQKRKAYNGKSAHFSHCIVNHVEGSRCARNSMTVWKENVETHSRWQQQ